MLTDGACHPCPATGPSGTVADPARHRLVAELTAQVPRLLDDLCRELRGQWPDYADFVVAEPDLVTEAATSFLRWLVDTAGRRRAEPARGPFDGQTELFEHIGRLQWREGRELPTLLSAYQAGARLAWRHVSGTALAVGVPPATLAALAEAVFAFVDELSSASAHGYVREQAESGAARERLRDELVGLLLSERPDPTAVRAAAARIGWPLPRQAAVVRVDPTNPIGHTAVGRLDGSCLPVRHGGTIAGAIVPDPLPAGSRRRLVAALRGGGAVIGVPVPPGHLSLSARTAEQADRLRTNGVLTDDPLFAADHLDAIVVHHDPELLDALRRQALAPLSDVAPTVRQRLADTLASWLRHQGDRRAVAADLHIHPQTVRYRMAQLNDVFGGRLDDPAVRLPLTVALAWSIVHPRPTADDTAT